MRPTMAPLLCLMVTAASLGMAQPAPPDVTGLPELPGLPDLPGLPQPPEAPSVPAAPDPGAAVYEALAQACAAARAPLLATPLRLWTSCNMGPDSGLDADLLDGRSSGHFLDAIADEAASRASADRLLAGRIDDLDVKVEGVRDALESEAELRSQADQVLSGRVDGLDVQVEDRAWAAVLSRDGAGSGLQADLLDGLDSARFLRSDQGGSLAGSLKVAGNVGIGTDPGRQRLVVGGAGPSVPASIAGLFSEAAAVGSATGPPPLPDPHYLAAAVWAGTSAYVFGGLVAGSDRLDQILRSDVATNTVTLMGAKLPTARSGTSAVWDGKHAYVFAGRDIVTGLPNQVVRYDPATDTVTIMSAKFPNGRCCTSAVWDGQHAYVFGRAGGTFADQIVRYDPATDVITVMGAKLPTGRELTSAVWDGRHAYLFGGQDSGGTIYNQIVRYDPATDMVTVMGAKLPTARSGTSAAFDDQRAYVFGGWDGGSLLNQIVAYDPRTDAIVEALPGRVTYVEASAARNRFGLNAHDYATNQPLPITLGWNGIHDIRLAPEGGNVGIGTTNPEARLDVAGLARVDGLTVDASSLGPCGAAERGTMRFVAGATGQADQLFLCKRDASGSFLWVVVA